LNRIIKYARNRNFKASLLLARVLLKNLGIGIEKARDPIICIILAAEFQILNVQIGEKLIVIGSLTYSQLI